MAPQNYAMYARYYDQLNNDYQLWHSVIRSSLPKHTETGNMIEFGCGTGNILQEYANSYSVFGVDISKDMLDRASQKLPGGEFYLDDMVTFSTSKKFDVALCLFDTINHVLDFTRWIRFFQNVSSLLSGSGIFILDANTTARLRRISNFPPLFKEFGSNYMIMRLFQNSETNFVFDVRILTKVGENLFQEEREQIEETTRAGEEIFYELKRVFSNVELFNENGKQFEPKKFNENEQYRWIFVCRR